MLEDQSNPASGGEKAIRKTAMAAGAQTDLEKMAIEQQIKVQEEMKKILKAVKEKCSEAEKPRGEILTGGGDCGGIDKSGKTLRENTKDGCVTTLKDSGCVTEAGQQLKASDQRKKQTKGQVGFNTVAGKVCF